MHPRLRYLAFTTLLPSGPGSSGIPEVGSAYPSPPSSPPLASLTSQDKLALIRNSNCKHNDIGKKRSLREGAAHTIQKECERLFCETLRDVFLGDEGHPLNASDVMDARSISYSSPNGMMDIFNKSFAKHNTRDRIDAWIEFWDYSGACSFRGFVGGTKDSKSLFAFFNFPIIEQDIKQGLMALIELSDSVFAVQQLVVCLDRSVPEVEMKDFMRSLRWVGFELTTLEMRSSGGDGISDTWLFLRMDI